MAMMNDFRPGGAVTAPSMQVEVSVSARELIDMDTFSKSDPMCVLFIKTFGSSQWKEVGSTETIDNNLNPDFVKKFLLDYFFEERQQLKFEIYDIDSASRNLKDHDFLGRCECSLGEIVSSGKLERKLIGVKQGSIILRAEEVGACRQELSIQFAGKSLDRKDWFGKSDPFLAFYRVNEDSSATVVHRTEVIKNNLNPLWKPFTILTRTLCGEDDNRSIVIKCSDWNQSGYENPIGEVTTNLLELQNAFRNKTPLQLETSKTGWLGGISKEKTGKLFINRLSLQNCNTFLDYIQAGTELSCSIAIDFTASNGAPTDPNSLHYISSPSATQYAMALRAVGDIIQDYDSDKLFPVLGFGARIPPRGDVSHSFFVNGSETNPYCEGVDGVLAAYYACLSNVQLYGPTNFAPVINHVASIAANKRNGSEYFILLIITDGVITDLPQTKNAIVAASLLPLSIIIVGVGKADFAAMEELDGDDDGPFGRLRDSHGRYAQRDIVQFVPFRDFLQGASGDRRMSTQQNGALASQARLAKEVLEEIPQQFLSYMKVNGITPGSWPGATPRQQQPVVFPNRNSSVSAGPSTSAPQMPSPVNGKAPPAYTDLYG